MCNMFGGDMCYEEKYLGYVNKELQGELEGIILYRMVEFSFFKGMIFDQRLGVRIFQVEGRIRIK